MKSFMRLVAKMPFCGKFAIANAMTDVMSSTNAEEREASICHCLFLLSSFVVLHARQGFMGIKVVQKMDFVVFKAYGALYAATNFGVTLVQAYLIWRIIRFAIQHKGKYRKAGSEKLRKRFSDREYNFSVFFTLAAQIAFLALYL